MQPTYDQSEQDAAGDAALRALFAEADRPPLADQTFVSAAMAGVRQVEARRRGRTAAAFAATVALAATAIALNAGDLLGLGVDVLTAFGAAAPQLGVGAASLLVAAAAAGVGLVVADR